MQQYIYVCVCMYVCFFVDELIYERENHWQDRKGIGCIKSGGWK